MIKKLLVIMGITADILTVLSVWCIGDDTPTWIKIVITISAVVLSAILVFFAQDAYNIKVKRYYYKENENEFRIYTKKNKYLLNDSVVSIYYKHKEREETCETLVAVGYVFSDDNDKDVQIKVFQMVNEELMRCILSSNVSCKNYYIKPNVEFTRISEIIFEEREGEYNV